MQRSIRSELTNEELSFFKSQGYLIVKNALNTTVCGEIVNLLWDSLPPEIQMSREDPLSHVGPFSNLEKSENPEHLRTGFSWRLREVADYEVLHKLIFAENLVHMAEQFLGEKQVHLPYRGDPDPRKAYSGIRGVYCVLPYGDHTSNRSGFHTDGHPFHLGMVAVLEDVEPNGGSFRVWPGSHKRFYPTFAMQYDQPRIPSYAHLPSVRGIYHTPAFLEESQKVVNEIEPVDCHCPAGSVVFWHHRIGHGNGPNYSKNLRIAVLADYSRIDLDECRSRPPEENMWHDWSKGINESSGEYSKELALSQLLKDS